MWKAWAHPLWPGGEVWFRHYMLSQPRIKCANSRCCILGCVRCCFFFPLVLVAFFVAVLQEQSCCFFLLPSACLALGQLLGVSAGDFRGLQERRVWWWKEKEKKKKEGGVQQWLCKHLGVCRPPQLPLSTARRKRVSLLAVEFLLFGSWWKKVCGK